MPTRHALDEVGWRHGADNSVGLRRGTCLLPVRIGPRRAQLASGSASHGYTGRDTWERQQKRDTGQIRKEGQGLREHQWNYMAKPGFKRTHTGNPDATHHPSHAQGPEGPEGSGSAIPQPCPRRYLRTSCSRTSSQLRFSRVLKRLRETMQSWGKGGWESP